MIRHQVNKLKNYILLASALITLIGMPVLHPLFHACGEHNAITGKPGHAWTHNDEDPPPASPCPICASFINKQQILQPCNEPGSFYSELPAEIITRNDSCVTIPKFSNPARAPPLNSCP